MSRCATLRGSSVVHLLCSSASARPVVLMINQSSQGLAVGSAGWQQDSPPSTREASSHPLSAQFQTTTDSGFDLDRAGGNAQPGSRLARSLNSAYGQILRADLASEAAAASMLARRAHWAGRRPDLEYHKETAEELLQRLRALALLYRTRPSLASPVLGAAASALGTLCAMLPQRLGNAASSGFAEALTEQYNDQLRDLRSAGLANTEAAAPLRDALRALRDQPRAAVASVKVPDIAALQRPRDLTLEEGVAGVVKFGFKGLLSVTARF